jgi:hypothetical protein
VPDLPLPSRTASAQATLFFFPPLALTGQGVLRRLPEAVLDRFDGDPLLIPRNAVPENTVPMLVLNAGGKAQLALSPARADLTLTAESGQSLVLDEVLRDAARTLGQLRASISARVGRLAASASRVMEIANPGVALAQHFCQKRWTETSPLNRPDSFELHAHKVFTTAFGVEVNSWVRNKSAKLATTLTPAVLVEQDMNTLAEVLEESTFDDDAISRFFAEIGAELDSALALYYPSKSS